MKGLPAEHSASEGVAFWGPLVASGAPLPAAGAGCAELPATGVRGLDGLAEPATDALGRLTGAAEPAGGCSVLQAASQPRHT